MFHIYVQRKTRKRQTDLKQNGSGDFCVTNKTAFPHPAECNCSHLRDEVTKRKMEVP